MSDVSYLSPKLVMCKYGDVVRYEHYCEGCESTHQIAVGAPFRNGAKWNYNGNADKPSFTPSVHIAPGDPRFTCHYYITDGQIMYLFDSYHNLAGKTVELPDIPKGWY